MPDTASGLRRFLSVCFVLSGASSLIAQVVWLRLTAASFGVPTPVLALLLSIFMAGLAVGSHAAGVVSRRASAAGALRAYSAAEAAIALSAFVVPPLLSSGRRLLAGAGAGEWGSALYHLGVGG